MNNLFYIPTHIINFLVSSIPFLIRLCYNPSTELIRTQEEEIRNHVRMITYKSKLLMRKK